jgi:hypothetical protein
MSSKRFKISARAAALLCTSFMAASLVAGCGDDNSPGGGSSGDAGSADEAGSSGKGKAGSSGKGGNAGKGGSNSKGGSSSGGEENEGGNGGTEMGGSGTGGAGTGGSAGKGGSGGTSGLGGSAGISGNAGKGGNAGTGGVGGSGGISGSAGKGGSGGLGGTAGSVTAGSGGVGGNITAGGSGGVGGNITAGSGGSAGSVVAGSGGSAGSATAGTGGTAGSGTAGTAGASSFVCGNHVKEGNEQCDGGEPPSTSSASPVCSNTCTKVSTQACVDCENDGDCFESVNNCAGVAADFNATQQTQCYSVISCIQASNCFDGTGTLGKCYCGDLTISQCGSAPFSGAGSPNGACVNEIKAGFPTFTSNSAILGGLVATDFPSGAAMKRLSCQKGANSSACLTTCGFNAGGAVFP